MFTNELNMALPQWGWVEKTVYGVETHWLSCKEKVLGAMVRKEGQSSGTWKDPLLLIFLKKVQQ